MRRTLLALLLFAAPLAAQNDLLLRNTSGTAFDPQSTPFVRAGRGAWTTFLGGAAFLTYSSESGPAEQRNEVFSTNWIGGGVQRRLGSRGAVLLRGRLSLEPYTIPDRGYPQLLQDVSPANGGPLLDAMRAHDLVGEAAVDVAFFPTASTALHLYAAPVGDPAFGTLPYAQRASSSEFAEAPFAYDIQETTHDSTRVVTAGFISQFVTVEGSVFHDAVTYGRHTAIDSGPIDSRSARLVLTPLRNLALQVSRAELGDAKRKVSSASITLGTPRAAVSAIWTDREAGRSGTLEATFRPGRSTVSARVEAIERDQLRRTHFTAGYLFDVVAARTFRAGIGANVDYHTNYRTLPTRYGHKPQDMYVFVRLRTQ